MSNPISLNQFNSFIDQIFPDPNLKFLFMN